MLTISSICAGASAGALLRWMLGKLLNPLWVSVPLGTLAANLLGGYLIGVAFAFFSAHPS
ncbi:MAG: fluoride efflux transporter CrcB, partial [Gammaproteobacteria bacterium]|nr:fluoride efflux transporter CrcB [Gammaproteobacteria bacterium]